MKIRVESEVDIGLVIVTSALRVDEEPGKLAERVFSMLTAMRFVRGLLLITAPIFGFSS